VSKNISKRSQNSKTSLEWKILERKDIEKKDIKDEFYVKKCDSHKEYNKLSQFHYIDVNMPPTSQTYGLYHKDTHILYGISSYGLPILSIGARKYTVLNVLKKAAKDQIDYLVRLNKLVLGAKRTVLHPSIRGSGIVSYLIDESHKLITSRPFIEHMSVMAYHNPFYPKNYDAFVRFTNLPKCSKLYEYQKEKGYGIETRLKTPDIHYGYALYIKRDILKRPEFTKLLSYKNAR
jgi:hypothetical protein